MRDYRPELAVQRDFIVDLAEREEFAFRRTLSSGTELLEQEIDDLSGEDHLSGDVAFRLHDTFGFPIELTSEILAERGLTVDTEAFDALMEEQKSRARAAWKGADASDTAGEYRELLDDVGPTDFLGYDTRIVPDSVVTVPRSPTCPPASA